MTEPASLSLLVLNTDLPTFPGAGGVEFLTMTRLVPLTRVVALASLAHSRLDLERSSSLTAAGVRLYLWKSPWLDAQPATGPEPAHQPSGVLRRMHAGVLTLLGSWRSRGRPVDTRIMDGAFANLAPGILHALGDDHYHAVVVIQSSAAGMAAHMPKHLVSVLVMHDIRARVYERRAAVATTSRERRRWQREASRYARFERDMCQRYDLVVTVSAEDAHWVREHYEPRRIYELRLPVDAAHFTPAPFETEVPGRIVFTGLLSHPPNVDAAVYFATTVLPRVRQVHPGAEFHIVGRSPVAEVQALAALPGVRVFADVPDIREHVRPAAVIVVPLRYGSGARQKILEAWSMEKCIVSTSIGAEGLSYVDGTNLFIADGDKAMAAAVNDALSDPARRTLVRHDGRTVVEREHQPEALARGYRDELVSVARSKAAADPRMRVLIDMRWMLPGVAGGIEQLARAFVTELLAVDRSNEYALLLPARCRHDFDLRGHSNVRVITRDSGWDTAGRLASRGRRAILARLRLPDVQTPAVEQLSWLAELGVEIGYSFPGYIHSELSPLRNVLVVPDIQHEFLPDFFSRAALDERRLVYTDAINRAVHICAISEFTRQTLIDRLGVAPERVTTIPLAADPMFTAADAVGSDAQVLATHGLAAGGYLYLPAHTWKHKNHRAAIEALRVLRDRFGVTLPLVCSGGAREAQPELDAQIAALGLEHAVRFLGYLPRTHLPALYRQAACLVFPSLFEGFGMPVLEAMACGCPVICSNSTSLPEIAGDAATLVNPDDPETIASAVASLLADRDLRHDHRSRGLQRATHFSWRRHTLDTLAVLSAVQRQFRRI